MKQSDDFKNVLLQHARSASQFAKEGQYSRLYVQSNRLLTDSVLWTRNQDFVLPGYVLRLAALEVDVGRPRGVEEGTKGKSELLMNQKEALIALLSSLEAIIAGDPESITEATWKEFERFFADFWKPVRNKAEGQYYVSAPDFVDNAVEWAFDRLENWWKIQGQLRGMPIHGLANEATRIVRAHGADARCLARIGLLQGLALCSDYATWIATEKDGTVEARNYVKEMEVFVQACLDTSRIDKPEEFYKSVSATLHSMMIYWREKFILYYDFYVSQQRARGVGISIQGPPPRPEPKARRLPHKVEPEE